jgi:hypothetical protein
MPKFISSCVGKQKLFPDESQRKLAVQRCLSRLYQNKSIGAALKIVELWDFPVSSDLHPSVGIFNGNAASGTGFVIRALEQSGLGQDSANLITVQSGTAQAKVS